MPVLVVVLLVCSMLPARWARVVSSQPRHLLAAAMAPMDHVLKPLADKLRRPPELAVELGNREEYERAQQQIVELQFKLRQATQLIAELSQVKEQLRLTGVQLRTATVTSWSGDRLHPTLLINRGTRHGVAVGMVVVRGYQLVGRVVDVGPVTATVRLITAPQTHLIASMIPPVVGSAPREVMAQLRVGKDGLTLEADTNAEDPVLVGDLAHLSDESWPVEAVGFVVGKVTRIDNHPDDPLLRRKVVVEPVRSLAHLGQVTLIVPATAGGGGAGGRVVD